MIDKININSVNSAKRFSKSEPSFGGVLEVATSAIQMCEANPMVNVAVLDLATAIVPRTVIESQTNAYAGMEAFRRESSGLIINCMIPGLIVAGVAKGVQPFIMGGKSNMADCWANEDTINLVTDHWKKASDKAIGADGKILYKGDKQKAKVYNTIKSILDETKGVDGETTKSFKGMNFDESIKTLTDKVFSAKYTKADAAEVSKAYQKIVEKTHISDNIKIGNSKEYFTQGLGSVMENSPKILRELVEGKTSPDAFAKAAKKLVTAKSLMGLGIIIPIAIAAQPINRWLTEKTSGKKGAPIYKDYEQSKGSELSAKDKASLARQKLISVGSIIGVAMLSIMKKPDAKMFKAITQFKGVFPSMDQARIISTATFASRMMASQDENDLREATVRDIATFSAFYFLGDYVAKGIATLIQKTKGIELINVKEPLKKGANGLEKFWHWTKNTALKSSDEIYGATEQATKYAKQMRAVCQLGNIAFSLIALGLVIPKLYRGQTEKKRAEELKNQSVNVTINKQSK